MFYTRAYLPETTSQWNTLWKTTGSSRQPCCCMLYQHPNTSTQCTRNLCRYSKTCGLLAEVEQMMPPPQPLARAQANTVPSEETTNPAQPAATPLARSDRTPKKAYLHITTPTMASIWLDVRITHCSHAPSLTKHLRLQELQKRREYGYPNDLPARNICRAPPLRHRVEGKCR